MRVQHVYDRTDQNVRPGRFQGRLETSVQNDRSERPADVVLVQRHSSSRRVVFGDHQQHIEHRRSDQTVQGRRVRRGNRKRRLFWPN